MIIYATKKTIDTYKLKMPEELSHPEVRIIAQNIIKKEQGDGIFEWGLKLFYFDRRKCLLATNFASRMTFVIADVKVSEIQYTSSAIIGYLEYIYSDDKEMTDLLKLYFSEQPYACFTKITNRSVIATMNTSLHYFLWDGNRMYNYISDNILHTKELNSEFNTEYPFGVTVDGKLEYYLPKEKFAELLKERYYQ